MSIKNRTELLNQIWAAQDQAYELMSEYDSMPHYYGSEMLYQAEGYIVNLVGRHPGITVTELATVLKKTTSACSQIVRKLRSKGFVKQARNEANNRIFNLFLTETGAKLYQDHLQFNHSSQEITFGLLQAFTMEELEHHLRVQKKLNEAYQDDICRSRESFASLPAQQEKEA